jgi:hypothetical protein
VVSGLRSPSGASGTRVACIGASGDEAHGCGGVDGNDGNDGNVQGQTTGAAEQVMVTGGAADCAAEPFRIAAHQAHTAAAQECGARETVRVYRGILADEEETATWLTQQLPALVQDFLWQSAVHCRAAK